MQVLPKSYCDRKTANSSQMCTYNVKHCACVCSDVHASLSFPQMVQHPAVQISTRAFREAVLNLVSYVITTLTALVGRMSSIAVSWLPNNKSKSITF